MKSDALIGLSILGATSLVAGVEIGIVQGPSAALLLAAGALTALMFSLAKGSGKVGVMSGNRGYSTEENENEGGPRERFKHLSDADREEIVQALFDKIFMEVGRSIVKKAFLILLSIVLAGVGWMAKNHIDIK